MCLKLSSLILLSFILVLAYCDELVSTDKAVTTDEDYDYYDDKQFDEFLSNKTLNYLEEDYDPVINNTENNNNNESLLDNKKLLDTKESFDVFTKLKSTDVKQLMKTKFVNQTVTEAKQKLTDFANNVRLNVKELREEFVRVLGEDLMNRLKLTSLEFVTSLQLSPICLISLIKTFNAMKNGQIWSFKFIDSMDLIPSGLIEGVLSNFGEYDECLDIQSPEINNRVIYGQYCLAKLALPDLVPIFAKSNKTSHKNLLISKYFDEYGVTNNLLKTMAGASLLPESFYRMGICVPSDCSGFEIERAINKILSPVNNKTLITIENKCDAKNRRESFNAYQIIALIIFLTLVTVVLTSTALEIFYDKMEKSINSENRVAIVKNFINSFSVISSTRKLFAQNNGRLRSLDTLMLLFVTNDFVGRSYLMPVMHGLIGLKRSNVGLTRGYVSDTEFFWIRLTQAPTVSIVFLSATILAYNLSNYRVRGKRSPLIYAKYLINRWLSFTRRIVGPILLIYLMPLFGSGPIWHYYDSIYVEPCKTHLIDSLLYFNNYAKSLAQVCNLPSVTISAMFQLHIFAPFLLIVFSYELYGYIFIAVLFVFGCVATIGQKLFYGLNIAPYETSNIHSAADVRHSLIHYNFATNHLITVFAIGLFVGYLIRKKPNLIIIGNKKGEKLLWLVSALFIILSIVWGENFKDVEAEHSSVNLTFWYILKNLMYASALAWIVFACCTKRAGILGRILSANWWQPLARLAIGIYLSQVIILSYRLLTKRDTYVMTRMETNENDVVDYIKTVLLAYFFYLIIECPVYYATQKFFMIKDKTKANMGVDIEDNQHVKEKNLAENVELKMISSDEKI